MCTNGVNTSQLEATITMLDEEVALVRRWTHRTYHLADDAQMERTAKHLSKIQSLLDDIRSEIEEARDALERDDAQAGQTTVTLV